MADYKTDIQTNNSSLQTILDTLDTLAIANSNVWVCELVDGTFVTKKCLSYDFDFSNINTIIVPEGEVRSIKQGSMPLWTKPIDSSITNYLPIATDTDHTTIYNGIGYYNGMRWSSSGGKIVTGNSTTSITGFIPCKPGDILRVWNYTQMSGTAWYVVTFDANDTVLKTVGANGTSPSGKYVAPGYNETTLDQATYGNFTNIRLSWGQFNSESIITINQAIL